MVLIACMHPRSWNSFIIILSWFAMYFFLLYSHLSLFSAAILASLCVPPYIIMYYINASRLQSTAHVYHKRLVLYKFFSLSTLSSSGPCTTFSLPFSILVMHSWLFMLSLDHLNIVALLFRPWLCIGNL